MKISATYNICMGYITTLAATSSKFIANSDK